MSSRHAGKKRSAAEKIKVQPLPVAERASPQAFRALAPEFAGFDLIHNIPSTLACTLDLAPWSQSSCRIVLAGLVAQRTRAFCLVKHRIATSCLQLPCAAKPHGSNSFCTRLVKT
eukprot:1788815-Amphidinium_carterae.1